MILLTDINTNVVREWDETIETWSNGYPYLPGKRTAFVSGTVNIIEVDSVPEEVIPEQYCYTEADGFYPNPNYREPDPFDNPQYSAGYEQALLDLMELETEEEE